MKQKMIFVIIVSLVVSLVMPMNVSAASGINAPTEFEHLTEGDGRYIKYADNYHLDIKKVGIMEKDKEMLNNVANFFFSVFKNFSYISIIVFYNCFAFDISEMFGDDLNGIQSALRSLLFDGGLFLIVFSATAFYIINQLLRGDIQGLLTEIAKVLVILILSMITTTQSDAFLHFVNMTTKQISVEALSAISGQPLSGGDASVKKYAADASGMLWAGLVHKPWEALEFGVYTSDIEENTDDILRLSVNSDARKELIENLAEDNEGLFGEAVGGERLGTAFVMALPIMLKCVFYLIIAGLQMFFQIFTLFFMIVLPVILLLAVSPQLGGTELIWFWLKKIIETQISILLLNFAIGLILKFDAILANWANAGWLVGLWLQVFVMIALVMNWQKVLVMMSRATRSIQNMRLALAMRQMRQGGGMYVGAITGATHGAQQVANLAGAAGLGAAGLAGNAGAALGGAFSGAWNGLAENYTGKANYNNVQQYTPKSAPASPPDSPPPGSSAPAAATAANVSESINANAAAQPNNVIDYNKIPKYKPDSSVSAPMQQSISQKVAVNGESVQSTGGIAQNISNSNQSLSIESRSTEPINHSQVGNAAGSTQRAGTYNYHANVPGFNPKDNISNKSAQSPSISNRAGKVSSSTHANGTGTGAKPGIAQRPASSYNSKTPSYIPKAGTVTEATQKSATANYNKTADSFNLKAGTPAKAAQVPGTADKTQKPSKESAQAKTPNKGTKAAPGAKSVSSPQVATGRNASILNNTNQFRPKSVVQDFEFKTHDEPKKAANISSPPGPQPKAAQMIKPNPVVQDFEFKTHDEPKKAANISSPPRIQPKAAPAPVIKPKPVVEQFNFNVHDSKG